MLQLIKEDRCSQCDSGIDLDKAFYDRTGDNNPTMELRVFHCGAGLMASHGFDEIIQHSGICKRSDKYKALLAMDVLSITDVIQFVNDVEMSKSMKEEIIQTIVSVKKRRGEIK